MSCFFGGSGGCPLPDIPPLALTLYSRNTGFSFCIVHDRRVRGQGREGARLLKMGAVTFFSLYIYDFSAYASKPTRRFSVTSFHMKENWMKSVSYYLPSTNQPIELSTTLFLFSRKDPF